MFKLFENPSIDNLLRTKENQFFDRKSERTKWQDIGDSMMGFANADGGIIAIGIEKDKTITGVKDILIKTAEVRKAAGQWLVPPIKIQTKPVPCQTHKKEASNILLVKIFIGNQVHSNQKDEVYLRSGNENIKLNHEKRMMLLDERGGISFELTEAKGATLDDLNKNALNEYKQAINLPKITVQKLLTGRDLAISKQKDIAINMAGILLFGKKPERWVERARIRILRYEGNIEKTGQRLNLIKDIPIYGSLINQIKEAQKILDSLLRDFTVLDQSGKFIIQKEYPKFAWQEAIINSVIHRAYVLRGADIQIKMFDDHLEIISPGRFPGPVTEKNIKNIHYSRNPRIARVMTELGFIKEIGEGVNRIFREMEIVKLPKPVFLERGGSEVIVRLENNVVARTLSKKAPLKEKIEQEVLQSLSPSDRKIITFIIEHGKISTKECENLIEKHRMTALRYIKSLVQKGFLKRVGKKGPKIHYILSQIIGKTKDDKKKINAQESLFPMKKG